MFCFDLFLVSVIAVFMFCMASPIMLLPLVLFRISLSFSMHYRKSGAFTLSLVFLAYCFILIFFGDTSEIFLKPIARMYDYICMVFTGDTSMLDGAYRQLVGPKSTKIVCPWLWTVFACGISLWYVAYPVIYTIFLKCKKRLVPDRGQTLWLFAFAMVYVAIVCIYGLYSEFNLSFEASSLQVWLALTAALVAVFVRFFKWRLRRAECLYLAALAVGIPAVACGYYMFDGFSVVVLLACSAGLLYLFNLTHFSPRRFLKDLAIVAFGAILFWTAQYFTEIGRIVCLIGSASAFFAVSLGFIGAKRRYAKAIIYFLTAAFFLPSVVIGYNQYRCVGVSRFSQCVDYDNAPRGLIYVASVKGDIGIRDRFGMVIPAVYDWVEHLGQSDLPYFKVKDDDLCGVYDIVRQCLVMPMRYTGITERYPYLWLLKYGFGEYEEFFRVPSSYSPYDSSAFLLLRPGTMNHPLGHSMALIYDELMPEAEKVDEVLCQLMIPYINMPDSVDVAEYKWQWAQNLLAFIDSIDDDHEIFGEYVRYRTAMDWVKEYVGESWGGNQPEMNCYSYVLQVQEEFQALAANIQLAEIFPEADFRKEYLLYENYIRTIGRYESKLDDLYDRYYSSRPMEYNHQFREYYSSRLFDLSCMLDVYDGMEINPNSGVDLVTDDEIRAHFRKINDEMTPLLYGAGYDKPTIIDSLSTSFLNWVKYRDVLEKRLPKDQADLFRGHTETIRYELLNPLDPEEDEEEY